MWIELVSTRCRQKNEPAIAHPESQSKKPELSSENLTNHRLELEDAFPRTQIPGLGPPPGSGM
ncbi:MAG TPA: hypothetical protein VHW72_22505, partial [Candidatus Angelobacter sp.]|nr:hypothetical protein [Candidatus Angelobacter sp.]